jgi:hypothetical protein
MKALRLWSHLLCGVALVLVLVIFWLGDPTQ